MTLSKLSVKKPVTVLIICILIALLGLNVMRQMPLELFPNMDIPYIVVSTSYPNASPEEVEEKLTKTLESSLSSVAGLEKITSKSSKGSSVIQMEFAVGTNLDEASNTIRDRIDMVKSYLPSDSKTPLIMKIDLSMMPLMIVVIDSPNRTPEELKTIAKDTVAPRMEQLDGVASTSIIGGRERAIRVEIPKARLEAYGLSFTSIAQMLAAQNLNSSLGMITENNLEYAIEAEGSFKSIQDISDTVINYKSGSDGMIRQIRLGEIANVYDGYKDAESDFYMQSKECVAISVSKQTEKNTVEVSNLVHSKLDSIKQAMPEDCNITIVYDSSDDIKQSISQVSSSAIQGAVLAILILLFFLRSGKSTIIIGITIPMSIITTLLVMFYSGLTLNLMTLAGLALGIGMLVDNAIVILENIYSYREKGTKPTVASVLGSEEMVSAITSSTLTTICVFLPMIMYKSKLGLMGQVFDQLALTVVISLLSSLVLAITLVPVLTSKYLVSDKPGNHEGGIIYNAVGKALDAIDNFYSKTFGWVFSHKKIFIVAIAVIFILACLLISPIGFTYMPETDQTSLTVSIEMPKGTALETTTNTTLRLADEISKTVSGVQNDVAMIGTSMMSMGSGSANTSSLMYMFYPSSEREKGWDSAATAKTKIEKLKSKFPEATLTVSVNSLTSSMGGSTGIDVKISSTNLNDCRETALAIEELMKEKGKDIVKDVTSDYSQGLPQVSVVYDRDKMYALGITIAQANAEIKANIGGMTSARYSDGGSDIDVVLSLPKNDRSSLMDIENIRVQSSFGSFVPLSSFADIVETRGALSISRENQSRVLHIKASAVDGVVLTEAQTKIQNMIKENIPEKEGVLISYSGDYESMIKFLKIFIEIIAIAALMVFAIMASQFESFKSPFIVIFTLPLGLIGIVIMYVLFGLPFNILTAVGALILVGVVVNNGIVLVDYTNLLRKRGMALSQSCIQAAKSRLRPVLMTTLTTILALVPMAFFPGEEGQLVQHVGITVFGGLTFGTVMTMYLIPCLYYFFNRKQAMKEEQNEKI